MESEVGSLSAGELSILLRNFFKNAEVIESEGTWGGDQQEFRTAAFGKEIWYWCIITAFILLLTESLISRHYKAESIGGVFQLTYIIFLCLRSPFLRWVP